MKRRTFIGAILAWLGFGSIPRAKNWVPQKVAVEFPSKWTAKYANFEGKIIHEILPDGRLRITTKMCVRRLTWPNHDGAFLKVPEVPPGMRRVSIDVGEEIFTGLVNAVIVDEEARVA